MWMACWRRAYRPDRNIHKLRALGWEFGTTRRNQISIPFSNKIGRFISLVTRINLHMDPLSDYSILYLCSRLFPHVILRNFTGSCQAYLYPFAPPTDWGDSCEELPLRWIHSLATSLWRPLGQRLMKLPPTLPWELKKCYYLSLAKFISIWKSRTSMCTLSHFPEMDLLPVATQPTWNDKFPSKKFWSTIQVVLCALSLSLSLPLLCFLSDTDETNGWLWVYCPERRNTIHLRQVFILHTTCRWPPLLLVVRFFPVAASMLTQQKWDFIANPVIYS